MVEAVLYFAYGSNLLRERLLKRCSGSKLTGPAVLRGHRLCFHKRSADGSGKCAFVPSEASDLFGVLWTLPAEQLSALDLVEGVGNGYDRARICVEAADGTAAEALTYQATSLVLGLKPYDWYLALVRAGAVQHQLPESLVAMLDAIHTQADPKPARPQRREALEVLRSAGFGEVADGLEGKG